MFSPYGTLINEVKAAETDDKPYYELSIKQPNTSGDPDAWDDVTSNYYYDFDSDTDTIATYNGTRIITMDINIKNCTKVTELNAGNIYLSYDNSIMEPIIEVNVGTKKKPVYELQTPDTVEDWVSDGIYFETTMPTTALDTEKHTFRIEGATSKTMPDTTLVATVTFKLADGKTLNDVTKSALTLAEDDSRGLQLAWDGGTGHVEGSSYLSYSGFSSGAKIVSGISLKTTPTKTQYYTGESLDFAGGEITVTYDDSSTEDMTIADAMAKGVLTASSTVATNAKSVTLSYGSKKATFDYYLLDSISVGKNLTKMSYEHGDTIDFAGGELTATYKNSAGNTSTQTLNIADGISNGNITVDKTKADVDNKTLTFTYHEKTTTMDLTVTDPVESISVTTTPTKLTYNSGDTISLAGGVITPITKSGKTGTAVATDDPSVTASTTTADITKATNKWTISGGDGLQAGNQTITLAYEGKTADITIVVNDTVSSISVTTQPTAKNKYGTEASALSFDGIVATVKTTGGATFTIGESSLSIDRSSYNANSLAKQSFPVKYGTVASSNNAELTLSNYTTGISVNFPDTEFNYGTSLSDVLKNATYTENYADGTSSSAKAITTDMVSGYTQNPESTLFDSDHKYSEDLTIKLSSSTNEFDKLPATASQTIKIKDYVESISIANKPSKTTYKYGEEFLSNAGKVQLNYKSGATSIISIDNTAVTLTEADGSEINMSPNASELTNGKVEKPIKVTYSDGTNQFTTSFNIKILDDVSSIAVSTSPTKTTYEHGDTFSDEGGIITVTNASGTTKTIDLDEATLTETDGSTINMSPAATDYTNNTLTKNIKVTYAGVTTTYPITINNTVSSISVTAPTKVSYKLNEATELTGGKVTITRKAGNTEDVDISNSKVTVSNFDTGVAGTNKTANVKYTEDGKDYAGTFTYDVIDKVSSITIKGTPKTDYEIGDTIEKPQIEITRESGATETIPVTDDMVSGFDTTTEGTKTVTITYGGKETSYQINVTDAIQGIEISNNPTKTEYKVGENLDVTGGTINITKKSGAKETKNITPDMISGFDSSKEELGQVLTVTYEGFTASYNVDIKDYVTSTTIVVPTKTKYNYGDTLDLSTGKIVTTWASGKPNTEAPITESMVTKADGTKVDMKPSNFDNTNKAQEKLKITANGESNEYTIEIINDIKSIQIKDSPKSDYNYGDTIDTSTGSIEVTRANGDKETIKLSDSKITIKGFDTSKEQKNVPVTIEYTENGTTKETNYTINVKDDVSSITLVGTPKTTYKYEEDLDLTGLTLTATRPSGTTPNIAVTNNMVSGYNPEKLGMQNVTITYGGKIATFNVDVKDYLKDIELVKPSKLSYKLNENLDLTGASITEVMASGAKNTGISVTSSMVSPLDSSTVGNKTLTVTYTKEGKTYTKQFIVVVTNNITGINVKDFPQNEYKYGEDLDLTGATLEVETESGDKQEIPITKDMITGYVSKPLSSKFNDNNEYIQTITIAYTKDGITKKTSYPVTTKDYIDKIKVEGLKKNYNYGDKLDLENAKVSKISASGKVLGTVSLTKDMISGYDSKKAGTQTLTIKYAGKETKETVTVVDNLLAISINKEPTKTTYSYGSKINLSGAKLNVVKNSGTKVIDITEDMISGFNPEKSGVQTITVTYEGKTAEFAVKVESKPVTPGISQ